MPLTDTQVKSFKPMEKRYRRSDGGGLFVDVMPSGKKVFRLAYRNDVKRRTVWIGDYPNVRLADARLKVSELKLALRAGTDPHDLPASAEPEIDEESTEPTGPLWRDIARDYLILRQRSGAAYRTLAKLHRQVDVTIKALGDRLISDITAEDVLSVVNPIAERGHVENAHEIRSRFSQVFRYAAARGLIQYDPAAVTIDAMVKRRRGEFAGITEPGAVGELLRRIHAYRAPLRRWISASSVLTLLK